MFKSVIDINMPIKDAKTVFMQGNVLCIYPKSAKHIIDIRGMSVSECPGDSFDLKPIQGDLNIITRGPLVL